MTEKELPVKEYLKARKEAIYSRIILSITIFTGATLSFLLVHAQSRSIMFENVSIGLVVFAGLTISKPYWTKKKNYEETYFGLKGESSKGVQVSGEFIAKHLLVYPAILAYMIIAFFSYYHPVERQKVVDTNYYIQEPITKTDYSIDIHKSDSSSSDSSGEIDNTNESEVGDNGQ